MNIFIKEWDGIERREEVVELYREVFSGYPWYEKWDTKSVNEWINDCMDKDAIFLLLLGNRNEIIGFNWGYFLDNIDSEMPFTEGDFYIAELGIKETEQKKGYGKKMMLEILRRNKGRRTWLRTLINTPAYKLYRNLGFKDIGPIENDKYYPRRVWMYLDKVNK